MACLLHLPCSRRYMMTAVTCAAPLSQTSLQTINPGCFAKPCPNPFLLRATAVRTVRVSARQADDPTPASEMTLESALALLGVQEGATFDEILQAKRSVLERPGNNQETIIQVEAAYDILLMQSLSKRRSGKVVDSSVKYADVRKARKNAIVAPQWMTSALQSSPVDVESLPTNALLTQAAVFGALATWTLVGGLGQDNSLGVESIANKDIPGVQLAAGFGASIYFLRQQNVKLAKASLITFAALLGGALIGSGVEAWLRVDIFPVLGISSPSVVVSEFVFLSFWVFSAYLR